MAEERFQLTYNGQQVQEQDLDLLGTTSGLADDRVFAELLRMTPYDGSTVLKGVLPFGHQSSANDGIVMPSGADGSVVINPFRAVVGPRTAVGDDPKENWRDIRSAIAVGSTTLSQVLAISANSSGDPRWDLVYASVSVETNGPSVTRKVKDPTTGVVTSTSVPESQITTVSVSVQPGTASSTPEFADPPTDAGGVYYIPLAYVRVPDGFNGTSTVGLTDIATQAPVLSLARATGGKSIRPASSNNSVSTTQQHSWGSTGTRRKVLLPRDMTGGETLLLAMDLKSNTVGDHSHLDGDVLDEGNWAGRICKWHCVFATGAGTASFFPFSSVYFDILAGDGSPLFQSYGAFYDGNDNPPTWGIGDTLQPYRPGGLSANNWSYPVNLANQSGDGNAPGLNADVSIICDHDDDGKLKLHIAGGGNPKALIFLWLEFSGPYTNL